MRSGHESGIRALFGKKNHQSGPFTLVHSCLAGNGLVAKASFTEETYGWSDQRPAISPTDSFLVYYPRPEHARDFVSASKGLDCYGPSDQFPGSVGVLHVRKYPPLSPDSWNIALQGSYSSRSENPVSRQVLSKYWHWRRYLFDTLFSEAKTRNIRLIVLKIQSGTREGRRVIFGKENGIVFKEVAESHGFAVSGNPERGFQALITGD